mgnify:FL=1|tara:strand:- start:19324 stop:20205 length:882 start_codon:yes stop_codon:yes gene_type:complete
MAVATAETIKTQILAGTYPSGTLETGNVFDYVQYEKRRMYPSCEILTIQPESTVETKKTTETTVGFEIRYFVKNLGIRSDSILTQKSVEDEIRSQIEAMTLQDHKVVLESKVWQREQVGKFGADFPPYMVSTLRVTVRQITPSTATADGVLKFDVSESSVDNAPSGDYTYTEVYDVDLSEGYKSIPEKHSGSNFPLRYAGDFAGNLICNIPIKAADLGTTGEKLNKLITLRTTGEHPDVTFIYTNKTGGESPSTITETFTVKPDTLQRLYRYQDTVVYRLTATVTNPSTITVS